MEDSDAYEILYEQGEPLLAFQICDESNNQCENEASLVDTDSSYNDNGNQTLQYFNEDEEEVEESVLNYSSIKPTFEDDLQDQEFKPEKTPVVGTSDGLEFIIVKNATKCNSRKLYDSNGYSYTLRDVRLREGSSIWRCRFKIDNKECGAKVKISGEDEFELLQSHRHKPDKTISFDLLKATGMEPAKPKNQSSKGFQLKAMKPFGSSSKKTTEMKNGCEKILDYFCEGYKLEDAELNTVSKVIKDEEDQDTVRYKVIENGSLTGSHVLYDSLGYSYSATESKGENRKWKCQAGSSSEGNKCEAQVSQKGSEFTSSGNHSHNPKRHTLMKINKMKLFSGSPTYSRFSELLELSLSKQFLFEEGVAFFFTVTSVIRHFWPSEQEEFCDFFKRSSSVKQNVGAKKIKTEHETKIDDDVPLVPAIKTEKKTRESFEFSSNEMSFLVSLENDDEDLDDDDEAKTMSSSGGSSKPKAQSSFVSDSSLKPYKEEDFNVYRELASIVFSEKGQRLDKLKYHIVEKGSTQGGPKLFDSRGFFYTSKTFSAVKNDVSTWICSHRSGSVVCKAKVKQSPSGFVILKDHCHLPDKEKFIRSLIRAEAIEVIKDRNNIHRPGMSIIRGIIESYGEIVPLKINVDHLVRFVNYQKRSFMDHNEIESCKYTFNKKKIPKNFLLNKIKVDHKFHLTFATEIQLAFLASACEWYIDEADLNIPPFTNVLSIHAFTEHQDGSPHQTPLFFAFESDRRETDYSQIFSSIQSALTKPPIVSSIVIDLNVPLRRSLAKCFPNADIKCCDIHWSEEISGKLKEMDLEAFLEDPIAMNYLYQLPLLNLLPRQDFESALVKIENEVEDDSVRDLICYIRETFGDRSLWPPKYWSCFKMPVQVNNHQRWREEIINNVTPQDEIYSLIRSFYFVAKSVAEDLKLMSKKKIKKYYLSRPDSALCNVYKEWKKYCKNEISCHGLLDRLAKVIRSF